MGQWAVGQWGTAEMCVAKCVAKCVASVMNKRGAMGLLYDVLGAMKQHNRGDGGLA